MQETQQQHAVETRPAAPGPGALPAHTHYADEVEPADLEPQPLTPSARRRMLVAIGAIVSLGLVAVLPPLINVNRYQRRIVTSISASLGRPVHLDSVALNILPMPGFTLTNFVVSEDPAFGSEPVIRANTVTATLRMRSLWHHRVEFSRISLNEPSVNLVHRADGQWNIESILLQASRMPVIPTAERAVKGIQRFPYIEATGARVNLKQDLEKKPISLLDAKFALWLAQPQQWRLRLEAHPTRTDTAPADTGVLHIEGTLGKAHSLANVPIDLRADWIAAPLGAASFLLLGHDADLRGEMTLLANVKGTAGSNDLVTRLQLRRLRRAEFVPARPFDLDINCNAHANDLFHTLEDLRCVWPPNADQSALGSMVLTGRIPDIHKPATSTLEARFANVPLSGVLDLLRAASQRVSPELEAGGLLTGDILCCDGQSILSPTGAFTLQHTRLAVDGKPLRPAADAEILGEVASQRVTLEPFELDLGGPQPAVLAVQTDETGLRMHLTGTALRSRLLALGKALPQFGDGLARALPDLTGPTTSAAKTSEALIRLDLTSQRLWLGGQTWALTPHTPPVRKPRRR